MSVINQNGLLGIASITSSGSAVQLFNSSGAAGSLTIGTGTTITSSTISVNGNNIATEGGLGTRNRIINGDMRIDQRNAGASVTLSTTTQFPVDRFAAYKGTSGATVTAQRSTTAPTGFTNSIIFTASTGSTPAVGDINAFWQAVEGFNVADLGWGTASASSVTLSFWVRSSVIGTYSFSVTNNASNRFYVATYSINVANTWEYKTITIAGDTSGTWATDNNTGVQITWDLGYGTNFNGTAGAWGSSTIRRTSGSVQWISTTGATFYITGVQLEAGSVATPFERRSYGQELALCQRYCLVDTNESTAYRWFAHGYCTSTTNAYVGRQFPVTMRVAPSITTSGTWLVDGPTFGVTPTSVTDTGFASRVTGRITLAASSGYTTGAPVWLASDGTTNLRSITYSAEL